MIGEFAELTFRLANWPEVPSRAALQRMASLIRKLPISTLSHPHPKLPDILSELLERNLLSELEFSKLAAALLLARHENWSELAKQPLFETLMTTTVNASLELESFLGKVREEILQEFVVCKRLSPAQTKMAQLISRQGFLNAYVWSESEAELDWIGRFPLSQEPTLPDFLVYSMYRAIHQFPQLDTHKEQGDWFTSLVTEPTEEQKLGKEMPSFGVEQCEVTQEVVAHYEHCAYPRWARLGPSLNSYGESLRKRFPSLKDEPVCSPRKLLVAGCGSGIHPLRLAQSNPELKIHAIDLSRSSLGHAKRVAQKLKLCNLSFEHGDLRLYSAQEVFDAVECLGVLHHMAQPERAWRVLFDALRPGGVMNVAVYSKQNRAIVRETWALAEKLGFQADDTDARRLRMLLLESETHRELAQWFTDYHSLSGFRDLFLHPQELTWTVEELVEMIQEHNFEFLGFELPPGQAQRYLRLYPNDSQRQSVENWLEFQQEVCPLFMHHFWVRKPSEKA